MNNDNDIDIDHCTTITVDDDHLSDNATTTTLDDDVMTRARTPAFDDNKTITTDDATTKTMAITTIALSNDHGAGEAHH